METETRTPTEQDIRETVDEAVKLGSKPGELDNEDRWKIARSLLYGLAGIVVSYIAVAVPAAAGALDLGAYQPIAQAVATSAVIALVKFARDNNVPVIVRKK